MWRVLEAILSIRLVPVMNLVAWFCIRCNCMDCDFAVELRGIIGYNRVALITVLYNLSLVWVDVFRNLAILLRRFRAIADLCAICGWIPFWFIVRPRTLPLLLYWIWLPSIVIGVVFFRLIAIILNLLLLVCIFQFASYVLICSIDL